VVVMMVMMVMMMMDGAMQNIVFIADLLTT